MLLHECCCLSSFFKPIWVSTPMPRGSSLHMQEPAGFEPEPAPTCSAETNAQTATTAGSPEPTTVAPAPPATTTAAPATSTAAPTTTTAAPTTTTAAPTTTTAAPTTTRGAQPFAVCSDKIVRHALRDNLQL